jgi:hypothetical protein
MFQRTNIIRTVITAVVIVVSYSFAFGEDLSSCTLKKTPDEQNYCKASFAGSGTFCDMIKNGEKKRECYFMVVKVQRKNAYQVPIPESKKVVEQP